LGSEFTDAINGLTEVSLASDDIEQALLAVVDLHHGILRNLDPNDVTWAWVTLSLGNVYGKLGDDYRQPALDAYGRVVNQSLSDARFDPSKLATSATPYVEAYARIQDTDRSSALQTMVPSMMSRRASAVYLRPLRSVRELLIPVHFARPRTPFQQAFPDVPELPLETLLYRAVGDDMFFISVGGTAEGFGPARIMVVGGERWQDAVASAIHTSDLIFLLPQASEGIEWEVRFLIGENALPRVIFVMPPEAPHFDVPSLWAEATTMMRGLGYRLPRYKPGGLLFTMSDSGIITERFSFRLVWKGGLFRAIRHLLPS
jgi:hypothetical protein